jgi:hypothetical protein
MGIYEERGFFGIVSGGFTARNNPKPISWFPEM